jgi:hypothetical protein
MAKTRLLGAICTVAMLAGAPAFAQTNTPTGDTGAGGAPNNPTNAPTTALRQTPIRRRKVIRPTVIARCVRATTYPRTLPSTD